jgi:hypothetical protein
LTEKQLQPKVIKLGVTTLLIQLSAGQLRASFKEVINYLKESNKAFDQKLLEEINKSLDVSGPGGWLIWIIDLRNMYVHRARRTVFSQIVKEQMVSKILNSKGDPIAKSLKLIRRLAFNPDNTDVEAWLQKKNYMMLNEEAGETLSKVMDSSLQFVSEILDYLLNLWIERRKNPQLRTQPNNQWRINKKGFDGNCDFEGYDPNKLPKFTKIFANRVMGKRMASASVLDHNFNNWDKFDL